MKRNTLWKKAVALGLTAVMLGSMVGCGSEEAPAQATGSSTEPSAETAAGETGEETAASDEEVITLKGFTMGNEPASGMDTFYEQLDALTVEDL